MDAEQDNDLMSDFKISITNKVKYECPEFLDNESEVYNAVSPEENSEF